MSDHGTLIAPVPALDDILVTDELTRRKSRPPDHKAEADALHALARRLGDEPRAIVQELVALAVRLCWAGSAGLSLLEETPGGKPVFRWVALAGAYEPFEGGTTPGDFSPCGTCLERQAPQLYSWPARLFTYFQGIEPPIVEALVVPLPDAPDNREAPFGSWLTTRGESSTARTCGSCPALPTSRPPPCVPRRPARRRKKRPGVNGRRPPPPRPRPTDGDGPKTPCAGRPRRWPRPTATRTLSWGNSPTSCATPSPASPTPCTSSDSRAATRPRERFSDLAARQVQQLTRLIDGLLDLARIRQGKMALKMETVDLNAVVGRAVETARPTIEGRCHDLEVAAPLSPILLRADPSRLEQVLVNLLHNAAKYTEVGGRIRLTVEPGAGGGGRPRQRYGHRPGPRDGPADFPPVHSRHNGAGKCRKGAWALASRWFARWSSCTAAGCRSSATAPAGAASS